MFQLMKKFLDEHKKIENSLSENKKNNLIIDISNCLIEPFSPEKLTQKVNNLSLRSSISSIEPSKSIYQTDICKS